jgi:Sec-independent protein secretion pathway component TatC
MVSTVLLMAMIVVGMTVAPSPPGVEQLVVSLLIAILMMVGIGEWLCRSAPHAVET